MDEHFRLGLKRFSPEFKNDGNIQVVDDGISNGCMRMDIVLKSTQKFSNIITHAATVFWTGPMGVFEMRSFQAGAFNITIGSLR